MKQKTLFLLSILLFTTLACQTLMPQPEPTSTPVPTLAAQNGSTILLTEDQVPRITVSEAKAALDSGAAILVDVRSVEAYKNGHAAGAVSIPLLNFENGIGSLSLEKDQWIITYCT